MSHHPQVRQQHQQHSPAPGEPQPSNTPSLDCAIHICLMLELLECGRQHFGIVSPLLLRLLGRHLILWIGVLRE